MRTTYTMLFGLCLGAGVAGAGCSSSTSGEPATGSSQARVVASTQGSGTTTLHLTATNDTTSEVTVDKTIEVTSGSATVLDLSMPSATYTFNVGVVSGSTTTGTSTVQANLTDGATTQIALAAQAPQPGGAASTVQIGVDVAPTITGVDVQASTSVATMTQIHIDASDAAGGALSFFWSGTGLDGVVAGSDTMSISTATITAALSTSPVLHVVVQDVTGASATADIALTAAASGVNGAIATGSQDAAALQACLDTQAQCNAACSPGVALGATGVTVDATCLAGCSMALATCQGG